MKWFAGAILILLAALVIQSGLLAYAMYVLLAMLLVSRLGAGAWIGSLSATRRMSQTVAEIGDEVKVHVRISNTGNWPVPWALFEDLLPRAALSERPPRLDVDGKRMQLRYLPRGDDTLIKYTLTCNRRGYYQVGPLVIETGDLFGLHRRYRVEAEPRYLLVYPKVVPLQGYNLSSRRPIGDIRLTHRLYEDPTRIAGVRPYEAGDPLNRIHWRATARTGALHSKIHEPSSLAGATILLDFHKKGYARRGEPQRSELAVTAAVSLANAVYELGQQIGLVTNGRDAADRIRIEGWQGDHRTRQSVRTKSAMAEANDRLQPLVVDTRRGVEQFQRIRETLARIELTDGMRFAELVLETASRLPRDATVVAFLPSVPDQTALVLGSLKRQGYAVSVVLIMIIEEKLEESFGRLLAQGIRDVRHLRNEEELPDLCQQQVRGATPYQMQASV